MKDGLHFSDTRYEWFTLGAYVVRSANEAMAVTTVEDILAMIKGGQRPDLHYARMPLNVRAAACAHLATRPARAFCLLSHKTNMREYTNPTLGQIKASEFYNWCTRLLLERVMYWYEKECTNSDLELLPMRVIFSERGGHDYDHMFSYFERLNDQARRGGFKKKPKAYIPDIMDRSRWSIEPHDKFAGLQLADAIASAFYQAANSKSPNWALGPARALKPIMADGPDDLSKDVGVTVWPLAHQAKLPEASRAIFNEYGYRFR